MSAQVSASQWEQSGVRKVECDESHQSRMALSFIEKRSKYDTSILAFS